MAYSAEAKLTTIVTGYLTSHTERTRVEQEIVEELCAEMNTRAEPFVDWLSWAKESLTGYVCSDPSCDNPTDGDFCPPCNRERMYDVAVDL